MNKGKILKKTIELNILSILFFSPLIFFGMAADPFWVVEKFYFKFSISLLVILYAIYFFYLKKFPIIKTEFNLPFFIFIIINLLGLVVIINIYSFLDKLFLNLYYFLFFYFIIIFLNNNEQNIKKVIIIIFSSVTIMSIYGILQSFNLDIFSWQSNFSRRAMSTLGNPNFLAGHLILILPILFFYLIFASGVKKIFLFIITVINTYTLLITQTRSAYLGFAFSLFTLFIFLYLYFKDILQKNKKFLFFIFFFVFLMIIFYFIYQKDALTRVVNIIKMQDEAAHIRVLLWKNSLNLFFNNFLLGTGAGNFHIKYAYFQSSSLTPDFFKKSDFYKSSHSHNDFIQIAAEYGIFGFLTFIFILFIFFKNALNFLKSLENQKFLIGGIVSGILALLIHAFFNFPFLIIPTSIYFFALLAIFSYLQKSSVILVEIKIWQKILLSLCTFICFFIMLFSFKLLLGNVYLRMAKENEYFRKMDDAIYYAEKSVKVDKENEENNFVLASLLEKIGNLKACDYYEKVYRLNPGYWEANLGFHNCCIVKDKKEDILKVGENIYKISPYSKRAILTYGISLYINNQLDEALKIFEKGIEFFKDDAELYNYAGVVYGARGKQKESIDYFERAINLKNDYLDAYYNMAVSFYQIKDFKKAKEIILKMKKLNLMDEKTINLLKIIENEK